MESLIIGGVVTVAVGLLTAWLKQSMGGVISALEANTAAVNRLTTDYKVQDEKLSTISHTLNNHALIHKALDASIDALGNEVNGVKSDVAILKDRGTHGNNRMQAA